MMSRSSTERLIAPKGEPMVYCTNSGKVVFTLDFGGKAHAADVLADIQQAIRRGERIVVLPSR